MLKPLTIYCIGGVSGHSYDAIKECFEKRSERLTKMGYNVLHPWIAQEHLRNELSLRSVGYDDNPVTTNKAICATDFWRVDQCDILFPDFTRCKERVSIGSVSEMSRAYAKEKLIISVLPKDNIHNHAFILEMSGVIFEEIEDAYNYFSMLAGIEPSTPKHIHSPAVYYQTNTGGSMCRVQCDNCGIHSGAWVSTEEFAWRDWHAGVRKGVTEL